MKQFSEQQIQKRWDVLPENLKEALFSEQNADIVWKACEAQHIPDYKIETIAVIVGDVILGFIHSEELAKEIQNNLNLNINIANEIAKEVDKKIFSLIKGDLEQIYASPAAEFGKEDTVDLRYKQFDILGKTEEPKVINITEEMKSVTPDVEIEKQRISFKSDYSPQFADYNKSEDQRLQTAINDDKDEIAPMIIHQQSEFKPTAALKSSLGGLFGLRPRQETRDKRQELQAIPAQVSIGDMGQETGDKKESEVARTEKPKVKIVHYSDFTVPKNVFGEGDIRDTNIQMHANDTNEIRMNNREKEISQEIKKMDIEEPKINPAPIKPGELTVNLKDFGGLNNNEEIKEIKMSDTNLQIHANNTNEMRINPEKKESGAKGIVNDFKMPETITEIKKPETLEEKNMMPDIPEMIKIKKPQSDTNERDTNIQMHANDTNKMRISEKKEEIKLADIPVEGDTIDLRSL